ncbi:EamA family transporter [Candidatus Pseudoscillospira sp. SGI.172]|uniref:EamA family transporter n=1 Tax=Candidatus Pseudoscillospira sp. SGI.172 TaxID=3420582 RepID=UPI0009B9A566|nr:EamA family transporter [Pseudoflavonifractor sp.]MDY3018628.1 EamA family transporter [Oscillospiraceae bacterium]
MNWFLLSLIAILFWSGSDLFSKMGSRPDDKYSHWKMVMAVGTVMGIHALFLIATGTPFSPADIITYLPASALYILSMILGYVGLRYIELSVSSPVCNSSGAVAALLCFFFLGETMSGLQLFGVVLVCAGVFALSVIEKRKDDALRASEGLTPDVKHSRSIIAIAFPLLYCLIDGLGTFADALLLDTVIAEEQANIAYELTFLLMAVFAFIYVVLVKKQPLKISREKPKVVAALCETAGQFAYVFAIGANPIVAAPMISSYCVASLLWSRLILKEKLTKSQYLVIAVAAVGIVILGQE